MSSLENKSILITGATGTVGKNVLIYLLENSNIKQATVFSRDEFKQHQLRIDMAKKPYSAKIKYVIGDVRDYDACARAFRNIDIVFHTAAIKHVGIAEDNPMEAVKTNILGTNNVINAAIGCNVEKVIGISTDKSVMPSNLYGSTKLTMEKLIINANTLSDVKFSVLRFGNILCSRGSVIPVFLKLRESGAINVTDTNVTRFTITPDEMVEFIADCANQMIGGETFIPKLPTYSLGQIVKIVCPKCQINITGLKEGERLHEYMISEAEPGTIYDNSTKYVICPNNRADYKAVYGDSTVKAFLYSSENAKRIEDNILLKQIEQYRD